MVTLIMLLALAGVCFTFYAMGVEEGIRKSRVKSDAEKRLDFGSKIKPSKRNKK